MKDQKKNAKNGKAAKTTQKAAKFTPQDQWQLRVNLLPKNIAQNNKDRKLYQIMVKVVLIVLALCLASQVLLFGQTQISKNNTEKERSNTATLTQEKSKYKEVQKTLTALNSTQNAKLGIIYNEADWKKLAENLEKALPSGCGYTSLQLSQYQLKSNSSSSSNNSSSSSSNSSTWGNSSAIAVSFTVNSNTLINAKEFISKYEEADGYVSGNVTSISNSDKGVTYTGVVALSIDKYISTRSEDSAETDAERNELKSMREQYGSESSKSSSSSSSSSSN